MKKMGQIGRFIAAIAIAACFQSTGANAIGGAKSAAAAERAAASLPRPVSSRAYPRKRTDPVQTPAARVGKIPALPAGTRDAAAARRGELLREIHGQVAKGQAAPFPAEAGSYSYRVLKGFMGNHISDYMAENVERLKALGLDAGFIEIATEGDRAGDLAKIKKAIAAAPKPVVLIGHSQGGVDAHDAYRLAPKNLKAKVAKLVLIQAPLGGSAVADFLLAHPATRGLARLMSALPSWGHVLDSLHDLSTPVRKKTMAALPPMTAADLKKTYALRTSFDSAVNGRYHRDMRLPHSIVDRQAKEASDGLVGVEDAQVPGAHNIYLKDLDHEDTVIGKPGWFKWLMGNRPNPDFRVGDFTESLLRLVFHRSR